MLFMYIDIGAANVKLSPEELQEINKVQVEFPTVGARYGGPFAVRFIFPC